MSTEILLTTLNARYIHRAFGLRYLKANLAELESRCDILEFTLDVRAEDAVEKILSRQPRIVGFSVFIWNVVQTQAVVSLLKTVQPEIKVVLGGPEVSYEYSEQDIVQISDYLITGWGDVSFRRLCRKLLDDERPEHKVIVGEQAKLDDLVMPYHLYTDEDIAHRVIYVEASRGCPFKCQFCLSALDKTAWAFDLDQFLDQMDVLYQRGARHFKFVDRTFNLKVKTSLRIMKFFLDRIDDGLFLHFEVVPDHLPDALKDMIKEFPKGSLQFEVGIQTFNSDVQIKIGRRQNNEKARENLAWLRNETQAHIHADLIFGLPGEDIASFSDSFDQLVALAPHEIQVGILKRLRGAPIIQHTRAHDLRFNPEPPYSIVGNDLVGFEQVQELNRFARYWDMVGNSGRFRSSLPILLQSPEPDASSFARFGLISKELFARTGQTHRISLVKLFDLIFDIAVQELEVSDEVLVPLMVDDFRHSGLKSFPNFMRERGLKIERKNQELAKHNIRQMRHF